MSWSFPPSMAKSGPTDETKLTRPASAAVQCVRVEDKRRVGDMRECIFQPQIDHRRNRIQ